MKNKIQYINFNGKGSFNNCETNSIDSPVSFNDFDINFIDLSNINIWKYSGSTFSTIDCISDINTISKMLTDINSKVVIILPQNIEANCCFSNKGYLKNNQLKNLISLVEKIVNTLIYPYIIRIIYNKTKTSINSTDVKSDFVFDVQYSDSRVMTKSKTSKLKTTILCKNNLYLTTLELCKQENLNHFLAEMNWMDIEIDDEPEWFSNVKYFNDEELLNNKNDFDKSLTELISKIDINTKEIKNNNFYKSCLYKSGNSLVNVINKILDTIFEYDYDNFIDIGDEDFLIEKDEYTLIGEIKGINSNIKKSNVSQTGGHRDVYIEIEGNEEKKVFALAIINRQRSKKPEDRHEIDSKVIENAERYDVIIITVEVLLKLFEDFKNSIITTQDIINCFEEKKNGILIEDDYKQFKKTNQ